MKVSEIMTANPITVEPSATAKGTADIAEHARGCSICMNNLFNGISKAER